MCDTAGGGRVLYQCREVQLIQDDDGAYRVRAIEAEDTQRYFENPIEAWGCFINTLDSRARRRIGDMLERDGRNRYTGEKKPSDNNDERGCKQ